MFARLGLGAASVAFLLANLAHGADHQRQGTERLTDEVMYGGAVLTILAVVALVLAWRRHPRAPLACAAIGLFTAAGVTAAHVAPHWSAFSDPYPDLSLDALSWAVMLAEIGAAAVLGAVGLRELRRHGAPAATASA